MKVIQMAEGVQTGGEYTCTTCGDPLNIIGLMQHDCEEVLSAADLSQGERSTLMYVEARLVDQGGELDLEQMNYHDQQNLKLFGAAGILDVTERHLSVNHGGMEVVKFTDRGWDLVRDSRQIRAAQHVDESVDIGDVPEEGDG